MCLSQGTSECSPQLFAGIESKVISPTHNIYNYIIPEVPVNSAFHSMCSKSKVNKSFTTKLNVILKLEFAVFNIHHISEVKLLVSQKITNCLRKLNLPENSITCTKYQYSNTSVFYLFHKCNVVKFLTYVLLHVLCDVTIQMTKIQFRTVVHSKLMIGAY